MQPRVTEICTRRTRGATAHAQNAAPGNPGAASPPARGSGGGGADYEKETLTFLFYEKVRVSLFTVYLDVLMRKKYQ